MDRCPKCDQLVGDGLGVHYNSDVVRDGQETINRLRRQLAQRDARIAELEATKDRLLMVLRGIATGTRAYGQKLTRTQMMTVAQEEIDHD